MSVPASVLVLFGLACPPETAAQGCPLNEATRARLEAVAVRTLADRGFRVEPAPDDAVRPTSAEASPEPRDVALGLGAARVVALDVAPDGQIWITHFVRGAIGPWAVRAHLCPSAEGEVCPGFVPALLAGLRPRRAEDVDFAHLLRSAAVGVSGCVRQEDRVPAALRLFGRVEMELEVAASGGVRVVAIAPARAAIGAFGDCLRSVFSAAKVGPFEGEPVRMRIPIDL